MSTKKALAAISMILSVCLLAFGMQPNAIVASASAAAAAAAAQTAESDPNLSFISPRNINYNTDEAFIGSLERTANFDARIDFPKTISILIPREGMFVSSEVQGSNWVVEGDPLATFSVIANELEIDEAAIALELAESVQRREIESQEAALANSRAWLETLMTYEDADPAELRRAELWAQMAEANLEFTIYNSERNLGFMRERLEGLRERSEDFTIYAPISGYVYDIVYFSVGRTVYAGQFLCRISDPEVFQMVVNATNLTQLRLGAQVTIETSRRDAPTFGGRVIGNTILLGRHENDGRAVIAFEDQGAFLDFIEGSVQRLTGLRYRIGTTQADIQNVLLAPRRAVNTESAYRYVNVLEDGLSKKRYVIVGLSNMEYAQILDGINPGDVLIIG